MAEADDLRARYQRAADRMKVGPLGAQLNGTVSPDDIDRAERYDVLPTFARDNAEQLSPKDHYQKAIEGASPKILEFLARNPVDDPEEVSYFENVGRQWDTGFMDVELADLMLHKHLGLRQDPAGLLLADAGEWTEEHEKRLAEVRERVRAPKGYDIGWLNIPEWFAPETARQAAIQARFLRESGKGMLAGGAIGTAVGSISPDPLSTGAFAAAGAKAGGIMSMVRASATLEGMLALDEFLSDPEIDPETAQEAALVVGMANGILEVGFGVERLIPRSILSMARRNSIKAMLKSPTMRDVIKKLGGVIGRAIITEGPQEGLQELVQVFGGEYAAMASEDGEVDVAQLLQNVATTETAERIGSATLVGGVTASGFSTAYAAPEAAVDFANVRKARKTQKLFIDAADAATKSPTASGSASAREQLFGESDVYIPQEAWMRYWQSKDMDPRDVAREVVGDVVQYDQAVEGGGDVIIPAKKYARHLLTTDHNTQLSEDVRLSPDTMTPREAKSYMRELQEVESDPVFDELNKRLIEDGGYRPGDANVMALKASQFWNANAERMGLGESAAEMLDRYGATIANEGLQAGEQVIMNQAPQNARPVYLSPPGDAEQRVARLQKRKPEAGAFKNAETKRFVRENGQVVFLGPVNTEQWLERVNSTLDPEQVSAARSWYDDIDAAFDFIQDEDTREQVVLGWLLANKNASPQLALMNALRAREQVKSGAKGGKAGLNDAVLRKLFSEGKIEDPKGIGAKLFDFVDSRHREQTRTVMANRPEGGEPAVVDVHSARDVGFVDSTYLNWVESQFGPQKANLDVPTSPKTGEPSTIKETQYEVGAKRLREITDDLNEAGWLGGNLRAAEVQAIGWVAMTTQMNQGRSQDAPGSVAHNMRTVAWEVIPGEQSPLGALLRLHEATPEQRLEVHDRVAPIVHQAVVDVIQPAYENLTYGQGGYLRTINPNALTTLFSSAEAAEDAADVIGYLTQQEEVWVVHPAAKGKDLGFEITGFPRETVQQVWEAILDETDMEIGFSPTENGIAVLFPKQPGKSTDRMLAELSDTILEVVGRAGEALNLDLRVSDFRTEISVHGNDWTKSPDGQGYISRLEARYGSDIRARLDGDYGRLLEQAYGQRFAQSTVRDPAGRRHDLGAGNPLPVREDGRVELVHYSGTPGISRLDPAWHGRGIAGAESARKRNDANFWEDRTYYGIGTGTEIGYKKEPRLGDEVYVTSVAPESLYDLKGDPLGLLSQAREMAQGNTAFTAYEQLIKQAGFSGYYTNHPSLGTVAAVFEPLSVESNEISPAEQILYQPAFHGSPHTFDKFQLHAIGTGEGAQAYGWGLYFTSKKEIAEYYRDALSHRRIEYKGIPITDLDNSILGAAIYRAWEGVELGPHSSMQQALDYERDVAIMNLLRVRRDLAEDIENNEEEWVIREGRKEEEALLETIRSLESVKEEDITYSKQGRLYEVHIPEQSELLDYDKPMSEQPDKVLSAIRDMQEDPEVGEIVSAFVDDIDNPGKPNRADPPGRSFYGWLTNQFLEEGQFLSASREREIARLASEKLQEYGIPGMTYKGTTSGERNFIIWDEELIDIQRMEQPERGYIAISPTRKMRIGLLEDADLSTFIHESGHMYLEVMRDNVATLGRVRKAIGTRNMTENQLQILKDGETILKWLGVESWDDIATEQHEKFARGFEAYTMEGKAPSLVLRDAFNRFRSWMLQIYATLTNLNVKLNNDVREVFDRMLATDEQIAEAREQAQLVPIFMDAISAGMTDAEFANYRREVERAHTDATEELQQKFIRERIREQRKWWREAEKVTREEVRGELEQRKEYVALSILRTGKTPAGDQVGALKLDTNELRELYPDDAKRLIGMKVTSAKEGMSLDAAASLVGYRSGDELVQMLLELDPFDKAVKDETRRRMLAEHGDLMNDGSLAEEARLAVMNEQQMKVIEAEIKALTKLKNQVAPFVNTERAQRRAEQSAGVRQIRDLPGANAARMMAAGMISMMRVRDLRPGAYLAAAQKASRQAVEAAARRDYQVAAALKQRQMLNLELYKAAMKARDETDRAVKYMKGFSKKTKQSRLAKTGYLDQIMGILNRFQLVRISDAEADRRTALQEFIEQQREDGLEVTLPAHVVDEAYRTSYRNMTVEEVRGLRDSIAHLDHLSSLKDKLLKIQDARTFAFFVDDLVGSMEKYGKPSKEKLMRVERNLPQSSVGKLWKGFIAMHRRVASYARVMDGNKDGGLVWEAFVRPFLTAANEEAERRVQAAEDLQNIFDQYMSRAERLKTYVTNTTLGTVELGLFRPEFYTQLKNNRFDGNLSHMGKLMLALNWGNEGNRQRVMDGFGWTAIDVQSVLDTLSREDWQFVQDVWAYIDSFWPEIAALSERVDGFAPEKIEGIEIGTPHGVIKGGYFPIAYSPELSAAGMMTDAKEEVDRAMAGATIRSTTRHGFRESRVAQVRGRPLNLDVGVIFKHVNDVIHDLTHYEALIDANRVLKNERVHDTIVKDYGPEVFDQFRSYLNDVAAGQQLANTAFERIALWLRAGVSIAGMGLNLITAAIQVTGFSQSVVRLRSKWAAVGLMEFYTHPLDKANWVREKSSLMRQRSNTQLREINEIQNTIQGGSNVTRAFFWMIAKMQQTVDMPTWLGAYRKALAAGESDAKAVAIADQTVVDTQAGGQVKDLAAIQRGNPLLKLFTAFYSYFNATMNLTAESMDRTNWTKPRDIGAFIGDMLMLYTVPAVLGMLIRDALVPGEEDEDEFWVRALREQLSFALSTLVGFREASGVAQGYFNYSGPAGTRFFADATALATQVAQGESDEALWRAANRTAGIAFHYPATAVDRTVRGTIAYVEGDTDNPLAVLTGPPKE